MTIRYASAFLSHSSRQEDLVRSVGEELARRGILVWIDKNELTPGMDLDTELRKAAGAQLVMVAFISKDSLESDWCREELEPRLHRVGDDAIVPVFFGEALPLVRMSRLLSERWLDPRQQRVNKLYIPVKMGETDTPQQIAKAIACSIYERLQLKGKPDVVIAIDQRGDGRRVGSPDEHLVGPNFLRQDWPALVYRPDHQERNRHEVRHGDAWIALRDAFIDSTNAALGVHPHRRVYITGAMQLALAWLIGRRFDRTTGTFLTVRNAMNNDTLVLDGFDPCFKVPLPQLDPKEVKWVDGRPAATTDRVSVALMSSKKYLGDVQAYRAKTDDKSPLAALEVGQINEPQQVVEIARWLAAASQGRDVFLYTSLPMQALVLLAALSTKHHVGRVTFLERDMAKSTYRACEMSAQ